MPGKKIIHKKEDLKPKVIKETPRWFYIIPVVIPILFFVFLEIGLRLFNYGIDYGMASRYTCVSVYGLQVLSG